MTQCVLDSYRILDKWNILSYKIQKEKKKKEKRKKMQFEHFENLELYDFLGDFVAIKVSSILGARIF